MGEFANGGDGKLTAKVGVGGGGFRPSGGLTGEWGRWSTANETRAFAHLEGA